MFINIQNVDAEYFEIFCEQCYHTTADYSNMKPLKPTVEKFYTHGFHAWVKSSIIKTSIRNGSQTSSTAATSTTATSTSTTTTSTTSTSSFSTGSTSTDSSIGSSSTTSNLQLTNIGTSKKANKGKQKNLGNYLKLNLLIIIQILTLI